MQTKDMQIGFERKNWTKKGQNGDCWQQNTLACMSCMGQQLAYIDLVGHRHKACDRAGRSVPGCSLQCRANPVRRASPGGRTKAASGVQTEPAC